MIKIEVRSDSISILGHANYDEYGKDIVCAAVSSVVTTTIEGIAIFDKDAVVVKQNEGNLEIIKKNDDYITNNLITNMLNLLRELAKKYPKNIKIIDKEA